MIAATATFALNAGLWFRRGRLVMVISSLAASCRPIAGKLIPRINFWPGSYAENPPIPPVQISRTTSLAEWVIGLFKTEVINQIGPWKSMREVEWETLKWVDWYNNRRLLGPIGYIPPAEAEEAFYANLNTLDMVA